MSQVCLLESGRLSSLLQDALSWSDHVAWLMVSATNGSILAHAYRNATPSIKTMRTQSTTMTAAYTVASEDVLVVEAQNMGAISVITPIGDHVLLAVAGPEPKDQVAPLQNGHAHELELDNGTHSDEEEDEHEESTDTQQIRGDLEMVSQELSNTLREALATMRWPDDI